MCLEDAKLINLRASLVRPLLATLQEAAQDRAPNSIVLTADEFALLRHVLSRRLAALGTSETHKRGDWEKIRALTQVLATCRAHARSSKTACELQLSRLEAAVVRETLAHAVRPEPGSPQPVQALHKKLVQARRRRAGFMVSLKRLLVGKKKATV